MSVRQKISHAISTLPDRQESVTDTLHGTYLKLCSQIDQRFTDERIRTAIKSELQARLSGIAEYIAMELR